MRRLFTVLLLAAGCGGSDGPSEPNPSPGVGTLRGRVLAAADSAVAGVGVTATRTGQTARSATTDGTGTYTFANLASGSWTVTAAPITGFEADGSLTAAVQVVAAQTVDAPVLRLRRTAGPPPAPPSLVQVTIDDNYFAPASVTVARNGTVRWTNQGAAQHNTTSGTLWASPNLSNGATFERTFPNAGTFNYQCTLHAGMSGTVIVP